MKNDTFVSQGKYIKDMIKKFELQDANPMSTPMGTNDQLGIGANGNMVDQKLYRSMIESLLYVTTSRPDVMFSVWKCVRYQASPRESLLKAIKRILRYLKGTHDIRLWFPKGSNFELIRFLDSDYGSCKIDRMNTSDTCQLLVSCFMVIKETK
jgi:glutamine phosphoribosylpyrophosphate amidotransferase